MGSVPSVSRPAPGTNTATFGKAGRAWIFPLNFLIRANKPTTPRHLERYQSRDSYYAQLGVPGPGRICECQIADWCGSVGLLGAMAAVNLYGSVGDIEGYVIR
jgi:hypothetical protein